MKRLDRAFVWATRVLIAGMTLYGLWIAVAGNTKNASYVVIGALIVALLSLFARHMFGLVPSWIVFLFALMMLLGSSFGFGYGMYSKWWPWDDWVHGVSGVTIGLLGSILVDRMAKEWAPKLPVGIRITIATMFAASIALLWELYEFAADLYLHTFFQQNDLHDTMIDLLYGTFWGLVSASVYYYVHYLHSRRRKLSQRV